jgi:hypothetical protein
MFPSSSVPPNIILLTALSKTTLSNSLIGLLLSNTFLKLFILFLISMLFSLEASKSTFSTLSFSVKRQISPNLNVSLFL